MYNFHTRRLPFENGTISSEGSNSRNVTALRAKSKSKRPDNKIRIRGFSLAPVFTRAWAMRGFPGREDHRRSSRGEAKNGGSCRWFRRPITPSHKKKNGLITPRIIHLLGSFIGKNGLIIGNRFTALQREPRGHPSIRSIFLVSLPLPLRSITNDGNRVGWQPNWFFLFFVSVCGQWRASYFHGE